MRPSKEKLTYFKIQVLKMSMRSLPLYSEVLVRWAHTSSDRISQNCHRRTPNLLALIFARKYRNLEISNFTVENQNKQNWQDFGLKSLKITKNNTKLATFGLFEGHFRTK